MLTSQLLTAFGAGLTASLSPCDYPLLPIVIGFFGTQAGGKRNMRVIMYTLGQFIAFVSLGIIAVSLGESLGFSSESPVIRRVMGSVLMVSGIFSWIGRLPAFMGRWNHSLSKFGNADVRGAVSAFLFGIGGTLLVSPCTSPILGSVLVMMAAGSTMLHGILLMTAYSFGFSGIFLLLGLGFVGLGRLPRAGKWMIYIHRLGAVSLFLAGAYYLSGLEFFT